MAAASLLLVACDRGGRVRVAGPAIVADADTLPALPPSTIEAPLTYDIAPLQEALEKAVPRRFGDIAERHEVPGNSRAHFAFEAERAPFRLSLDGRTARLTAVVSYMGRVWYDPPVAPEVSGSCGMGDEARPRLRIQIAAPIRLTPDWRLRSSTRVERVEPYGDTDRDRCTITFLSIDVTQKVVDAARNVLEAHEADVDARVARIPVREKFAEWWRALERPIRLADGVWLVIDPLRVDQGAANGQGTLLVASARLTASPRIVTGPRPEVARRPLPPLGGAAVGDGFHAMVEGALDYGLASELLTRELHGKRIERGGRSIVLQRARVYGIGGGRLAVALDFTGALSGRVYFVGTPRLDAARHELYVPDLDFDVASQNALVSGLEWIGRVGLGDELRQRARWPVGGLVRKAGEELEKGLNRRIASGVTLSGRVTGVRVLGVRAARRAIFVRAEAIGNARLDVDQGTEPRRVADRTPRPSEGM